MKKFLMAVVLLSFTTVCFAANEFNQMFSGIKSSVNSELKSLTKSIVKDIVPVVEESVSEPVAKEAETETGVKEEDSKPEITVDTIKDIVDQVDQVTAQPVEVKFFGGLNPDSNIVDVINVLKKYDSVKTISIRNVMDTQYISQNNTRINFKTAYIDKATLAKYLESFIPTELMNKRYGYVMADYTAKIELTNGVSGKVLTTKPQILIEADTIYLENIPFSVEVYFQLANEYYGLHPDKTIVGANKKVAYPFLIERFVLRAHSDAPSAQLVKMNKDALLEKYIAKYGVVRDQSCYEGAHCNDFIGIRHYGDQITYKNYDYINKIKEEYNDYLVKKSMKQTADLDSASDI